MAYLYWLNSMVYIEVGDYMKVDTDKIEWLLNNVTQYRINKDTGVNVSILGRLVRGERKIENLTIKTGSALTEYAEKLQKQEK
nr:MAG TPA: hypothetical protein [Caudoviricetes sp.]DAY13735.1 MAG TPA: hypothetical protein [Caudoviricetes sp.]